MISRLHYITQGNEVAMSHALAADSACSAGVRWVQLRLKDISDEQCMETAVRCRELCDFYGAKLIINDRADVAKQIGADGVHLGKNDKDPLEARAILGEKAIIGGTANTMGDIRELAKKKVDYIGLGPFRFTTTKGNLSPVLGFDGYREILKRCLAEDIHIPIIAIGGIQTKDIYELMKTGIYGIAVASLINKADDQAAVVCDIYENMGVPAPIPDNDHFAKA